MFAVSLASLQSQTSYLKNLGRSLAVICRGTTADGDLPNSTDLNVCFPAFLPTLYPKRTQSLASKESIGTFQTTNGAALLVNVGHVQRSLGDLDAALATYKEARHVFKASGSWNTPAAQECKKLIGMLLA